MEKHKEFEEHRKKHYEMRDVKGMLGYVSPFYPPFDAQQIKLRDIEKN